MTGHVLAYSVQTGAGAISGDDGNRYTFTGADWRISEPPERGMRVDFDPDGNSATGIYAAISASPATPADSRAPALPALPALPAVVTTAPTRVRQTIVANAPAHLTMQSVVANFEFASPPRRIAAWFVDLLFIICVIFTLGIGLVVWLVIALLQGRSGQSPGKALLGIRVVRRDGSQPGFGLMLGRALCRLITGYLIPFASLVSFVMMLSDNRRRAIHDHLAGTLVVRKR